MKHYLGIELGSTRIKAVLIGEDYAPVASGEHDWDNRLENGYWTYRLEDAWDGLRDAYAKLSEDFRGKFGKPLSRVDGLGISGMMHGYLAFDKDGKQLALFRTWRNTTTERAACLLTEALRFNIPQRWSVAHLYQAMLDGEPHVKDIAYLTTLAGYVHWILTGVKAVGIGEASGMFPISGQDYDGTMLARFQEMAGIDLRAILPQVLLAGDGAGTLTASGAMLLDPSGTLEAGIPMCPPEGDAGTGMVATNSVAERTGNVSAGTSVFAMVVLEKPLANLHTEIDMVTTPSGKPVAMVHCNSCTSDLDAWARLLGEAASMMGAGFTKPELYDALYNAALEGAPDGGGMLSYNYYSGEPITGLDRGLPLFVRRPDSALRLGNFMRVQLYGCIATLRLGMDILTEKEHVTLDTLWGHGGLFKTKHVGQRLMASALNVPVAVMETASEGGAWGIALLAAYAAARPNMPLEAFLGLVFAGSGSERALPLEADRAGFEAFMRSYKAGLAIERAAAEAL